MNADSRTTGLRRPLPGPHNREQLAALADIDRRRLEVANAMVEHMLGKPPSQPSKRVSPVARSHIARLRADMAVLRVANSGEQFAAASQIVTARLDRIREALG